MIDTGGVKHACCFDVQVFDDNNFDPSAFVASTRALVPLERLRDDLHAHLQDRKQELYDLINNDYADFILVSTKLSGVGAKVADLREPMARLLSRASGLRSSAEAEASHLEAKLEERRGMRERKASIQRCLRFMCTMETAERILGIADTTGAEQRLEDDMDATSAPGGGGGGTGSDPAELEENCGRFDWSGAGRGGQLASWDQDEEDEDVDDPELLAAFPGLLDGTENGSAAEATADSPGDGSSKSEAQAAAECALLERAAHYALMMNADLQAAAEDEAHGAGDAEATSLLRGMSSRASRVEAEITRRLRSEFGSLVRPPQTLTASSGNQNGDAAVAGKGNGEGRNSSGRWREEKRQALLSCLRPFSALGTGIEAEKQFARAVTQPFLDAKFTQGMIDGGERGSNKALGPLLDEMLSYVREVSGDAFEAAEDMFTTPVEGADLDAETGAGEGSKVGGVAPLPVDLVCNGVWRPLQQVFMTRLSGIFATGMVAAQHTNYLICMNFLEGLAGVAGEVHRPRLRERLLGRASVAEFKARWNLPIYFQLRSREISSRLETALATSSRSESHTLQSTDDPESDEAESEDLEHTIEPGAPTFELAVLRRAWRSLLLCWDPKVFLPSLAHRFLRLTLQGVARVGAWAGSAEVLALPPDDIVPVASDLNRLLLALKGPLVEVSARRVSAPAAGERGRGGLGALSEEEAKDLIGQAMAEALGAWDMIVQNLWEKATSRVAEQCTSMLQAVKGITATYRMTNKPAPQRPSPFVPNILRALREFDAKWGSSASDSEEGSGTRAGDSWKDAVVMTVCSRYLDIVSDLLQTVRQMENTLNKRRVTARRGSRVGAGDQGPSDKDKIMMQLRLDVSEFSREASRLGVDVSAFPSFTRLLEVVEAREDASSSTPTTARTLSR